MYIVTVIPIKKGLQKEHLTYFSMTDIPVGHIVVVQVRSKNIDAIVINTENARELKSGLKNADFQLKKIVEVKGQSPFSPSFFITCQKMKNYTASNTGAVIKNLLPSVYLENISLLENLIENNKKDSEKDKRDNIEQEKLIFQAPRNERMSWYRTFIRESFAKKESVFICLPTKWDIEEFKGELSKGIEPYVYVFHGDLSEKRLVTLYNQSINESHPILIIGTGMFLSVPRHDIQTIIVEHESSYAYKQYNRPYIDIRSFAEILASIDKTKLILGDTLLRPETIYRHNKGELGEVRPPVFHLPKVEKQIIVDMKEEVSSKGEKKFKVIFETTRQMIEYGLSKKESVFLMTLRKGYAPTTVCHDCGHTILCPNCSTPIVVYNKKNGTKVSKIFMCNKCGHKDETEIRCPSCESWNLTPLGIGTERVYEEIHALFPEATIIQIDKEATSTDKQIQKAIDAFQKTEGAILIGTELIFSHLHTQINHSAIVSLDSLLSIPSFNITQRILHIVEKLQSITKKNLIIQTRIPENTILKQVFSSSILPLYQEDLKEREQFGYPPFKRLIKITFTGTAPETKKAREYIEKNLGIYKPQIFSAFVGRTKGNYITNTVIKVDPKLWTLNETSHEPSEHILYEILSSLPPSFSVNVDPEDLL